MTEPRESVLHFHRIYQLNINSKTPLVWRIFFTDEDALEEHIATVGRDLQRYDVMNRCYWVLFIDDAQEREYLSMIKSDPRVLSFIHI